MPDLLSPIWGPAANAVPTYTPREWESLLGQARRAGLLARLARLDASESRYRLLLDAHQLWPLDMDDGADGDHDHP